MGHTFLLCTECGRATNHAKFGCTSPSGFACPGKRITRIRYLLTRLLRAIFRQDHP